MCAVEEIHTNIEHKQLYEKCDEALLFSETFSSQMYGATCVLKEKIQTNIEPK